MGFSGSSAVKNPHAVQEPQETRVLSLGWEDPLEEGVATHSSILAWRIPQTEKPVAGYSPWDCKRVAHTLANKRNKKLTTVP